MLLTRAPIGTWKCNFPPLGNYERRTTHPTNRPTNQPANGHNNIIKNEDDDANNNNQNNDNYNSISMLVIGVWKCNV